MFASTTSSLSTSQELVKRPTLQPFREKRGLEAEHVPFVGSFEAALAQIITAHEEEIAELKRQQLKLEAEIQRLTIQDVNGNSSESTTAHETTSLRHFWDDIEGKLKQEDYKHIASETIASIQLQIPEESPTPATKVAIGETQEDIVHENNEKAEDEECSTANGSRKTRITQNEDGTFLFQKKTSMQSSKSESYEINAKRRVSFFASDTSRFASSEARERLTKFMFGHESIAGGGSLCQDGKISLHCITEHPAAHFLGACIVALNALIIGLEVEYGADNHDLHSFCEISSIVCTAFFATEVGIRLWLLRLSFFTEPGGWYWNVFELLIVMLSIVDALFFIVLEGKVKVISAFKILKLVRVIRVFFILRFSRHLARLALMITATLKSLIHALTLLSIELYVFAVAITIFASDWIHHEEVADHPDPLLESVRHHYGKVSSTIYVLFQSIMGGVEWYAVCDLLFEVGAVPSIIFIIYLIFNILAVLNVITGISVDNAFRVAENNRNLAVEAEMELREEYLKQLANFFEALDEDGSGNITVGEMSELLSDDVMAAYFRVLGFNVHDAERFLNLLDEDEDGSVNCKEFIEGCTKFRGPAQSSDVHILLLEQKRLMRKVVDLLARAEASMGVAPADGEDD